MASQPRDHESPPIDISRLWEEFEDANRILYCRHREIVGTPHRPVQSTAYGQLWADLVHNHQLTFLRHRSHARSSSSSSSEIQSIPSLNGMSVAANGIGRFSGRTMKIDVGIYNGNVDIGDFLRAIDFKVATEGKGYTEEEAPQARWVLLTMRVSTEVHEYINSLLFGIQDDYDTLKNALKEQYTNQDDDLDALRMEIRACARARRRARGTI